MSVDRISSIGNRHPTTSFYVHFAESPSYVHETHETVYETVHLITTTTTEEVDQVKKVVC